KRSRKKQSTAWPIVLRVLSKRFLERAPQQATSMQWWRAQNKVQRIALFVLVGIALILLIPRISSVLASGAGYALIPLYLLAYLLAVVALPLLLFTLVSFVYTVFARPYLRLLRMRRFRNNRYLRDAVRRGSAR